MIHSRAKHVPELARLALFASVDIDAHAIYAGRSEGKRGPIKEMRIVKRNGKSAKIADVRKELGTVAKVDTSAPRTFHGAR
jgi:hypothetical protein